MAEDPKDEPAERKTLADEVDKRGIGAAEKAGLEGPEGGWTPAKGGRRSEDEGAPKPGYIPPPKAVKDAAEPRDTDDKGGPDA